MGDVVNLRIARKRKARAEREREAESARALYGRTRAEKQMEDARRGKDVAFLDGHRRESQGPAADGPSAAKPDPVD